MKKRILLLVTILMMLSLVACAKPSVDEPQSTQKEVVVEDTKDTENKESEELTTEETIEPATTETQQGVTVTDHLKRTVTIENTPEKIVSGYYISTSALIALGLEDKLVGIEAKAAARPIYALSAPELLDLPNVGTAKEFDLEGCVSLKPDLVILPIKLKDQINTLEEIGVTVIGVNPENEELLVEMITMIATLTGVEDYEKLITYYAEKGKELETVYANTKDKPSVYLAGNSSMLSTATANMYQNDLIEAAGGINVANNIEDSYWANISYEQLMEYNPDYIIIAPEAEYTIEDVMKDSNLSELSAIKNNKVLQMPTEFEAWDSPVPSSILGKMWLTSILHNEQYSIDNFAEDVYNFYNEFYDFEIDKGVLQ